MIDVTSTRVRRLTAILAIAALASSSSLAAQQAERPAPGRPGAQPSGWRQHEMNRPKPPEVTPASTPGAPPSDAVVLFDGRDLSAFVNARDSTAAPGWKVENGYVEVARGTGSIRTKQSFGDMQLHVEWVAPDPPFNTGQNRGNSGVILMGMYEIQVLDSYHADTYPDGQAAAVYGQYPPLANASRPPGEWQTYEIYFRRPRFRADGSLQEPARVTVVHNGVLAQNNETIYGPTSPPPPHVYAKHADALPFSLQDHGQPVRYRNIWVRRLPERAEPPAGYVPNAVKLTRAQLRGTAGTFGRQRATNTPAPTAAPTPAFTITVKGDEILVAQGNATPVRAIPTAPDRLWVTGRAAELVLTRDANGVVTAVAEEGSSAPPAVRASPKP
jgi:hypothetical protein